MSNTANPMIVTLTLADLDALLERKLAAVAAAPQTPRILDTAQCAAWLGCTPQAVNKWCRVAGMPFIALGSERRFEPEQVIAWARSRGHVLDLPDEPKPRHLRAVRKGG